VQVSREGDDLIAAIEDDAPVEPPAGRLREIAQADRRIGRQRPRRLDLDPCNSAAGAFEQDVDFPLGMGRSRL
jgi:hypothetical protein